MLKINYLKFNIIISIKNPHSKNEFFKKYALLYILCSSILSCSFLSYLYNFLIFAIKTIK